MLQLEIVWDTPPSNWLNATGAIHVWAVQLNLNLEKQASFERLLSSEERDRAKSFAFESHRNSYICRRGYMREILSTYLNLDPGKIIFNYGERGKPFLAFDIHSQPLHFNLSHTESLLLIAVSKFCPVGIDVERIRFLENLEALAIQILGPTETTFWESLPEKGRNRFFFNLWTRKEALLKATGRGITEQLKETSVLLNSEHSASRVTSPPKPAFDPTWKFKDLEPADGYVAAVAAQTENLDLFCWRWPGLLPS